MPLPPSEDNEQDNEQVNIEENGEEVQDWDAVIADERVANDDDILGIENVDYWSGEYGISDTTIDEGVSDTDE